MITITLSLLMWKFGKPIRAFIRRYYSFIALGWSVGLVGSIFIIKMLL